ncbi:MAG: hypothetical protein K0S11_528 [Gammaproteobacteria bacterium]|jgi:drug/metabolite transporter (DMT)-like permease|nr:hypothetical protein [Gammaproteobacteria bacterium]
MGAIMISICPIFVKLSSADATFAAFYRMLFGAICLFIIAAVKGESLWQGWRPLLWAGISGVFLSTDLVFWHTSIKIIGPGLATILGNFQVFILVLVGLLHYQEKVRWYFYLALPLAIIGLYLLVGIDPQQITPDYIKGVICGLATAIFYGFFVVALRKSQALPKKLQPMSNMAWLSLISCGYLLIVAKFEQQPFLIPDLHNLLLLFAYGLFGQVIGWLLISYGLPLVPVSLAGFYILLQPSLAFIWDVVFLQRPLTLNIVLGAIMIFAGVYLSTASRVKD